MCCEYFPPACDLPVCFLNNSFQRAEGFDFGEVRFIIFSFVGHDFCALRNLFITQDYKDTLLYFILGILYFGALYLDL